MSVARAYAGALLGAAQDSGGGALTESLGQQLDEMAQAFRESRELRVVLQSPITTEVEKIKLVEALSARLSMAPLMQVFLKLLAQKGRFGIFEEIASAYEEIRLRAEGGMVGTVAVADAIEAADLEGLVAAFSKKLGKKIRFRVKTDPSLLAGMRVQVGGTTYDGSLRTQLDQARERLTNAIFTT